MEEKRDVFGFEEMDPLMRARIRRRHREIISRPPKKKEKDMRRFMHTYQTEKVRKIQSFLFYGSLLRFIAIIAILIIIISILLGKI
jgi:hypothetical protein